MISTSFLRTLSLKKTQDFALQNKNRLKVYYIRTLKRMNREQLKNSKQKKIYERCLCKQKKPETSMALSVLKKKQNKVKVRPNITTTHLHLFQTQMQQLENDLFHLEKASYSKVRKMACLSKNKLGKSFNYPQNYSSA